MGRVDCNSIGMAWNFLSISITESASKKEIIENLIIILGLCEMNTFSCDGKESALPTGEKMKGFFKSWLIVSSPCFFIHFDLKVNFHLFYVD